MRVLILGVNGFIGSALVRAILERTNWSIVGMDLCQDRLAPHLGHPRLRFAEGDIAINREWIEYQISGADVVLPLVAIATPMAYVREPLEVFRLTFEENLKIVRLCAKYGRRIVFPSTSEVYGMCADAEFVEDRSHLVLGPIDKQRWIYACSKQLLDRVIWALGADGAFDFTLFRPFNWIGPGLDDVHSPKEGSSRVVTQFIANLLEGRPIELVDGGAQTRCLTYIDDGIDGLMRVIDNAGRRASGQIFNLGNPGNECSMEALARRLVALFRERPELARRLPDPPVVAVSSADYYGPGYQDIQTRKPDIERARALLGWTPRVDLETALRQTLEACLDTAVAVGG